jgi:uncharacterized protein
MSVLLFNVAQLLREEVGAQRTYTFTEGRLPLDEALVLRDVAGHVRFTRTMSGVFAQVDWQGVVELVCVRSLESFDFGLVGEAEEEFHSVIDVVHGGGLPKPTEEDPLFLDTSHRADVGEVVREYSLLALPLSPVCEAWRDSPVSYTVESDDDRDAEDGAIDGRLSVLRGWVAAEE